MTPEKFFDYLEGKLPQGEKESLERALISDPELQRQFVTAREIHRGMQASPGGEGTATRRAGNRGRQVAAAFAVLVAMNVFLGLYYIFRANKPSEQVRQAREASLRHQLESAVEKSAAAVFTPPTIGMERVAMTVAPAKQDEVVAAIIAAASKAGGSGTKTLPNDSGGLSVLVLVPAAEEGTFRHTLATLGAPPAAPSKSGAPASLPNDIVHLEIVISAPR